MAFPSLTSGIFSAATGGVADEAAQAAQAFRDSSSYMPTAVDQASSALIAPPVDNTPLSWTQPGAIQPWTPTPFAGEAYEPAPTPVWTPTGMTTTDPDKPYVRPDPPPPPPDPPTPPPPPPKPPTPGRPFGYTYNEGRGGVKVDPTTGALTIDRDSTEHGWSGDMEDGWDWSESDFLADAYNYNAPNGVFGDLGNGYFIKKIAHDDDDEENPSVYYTYELHKTDKLYNSNAVSRSMGGYLDRGVGSLGPSYL